MSFTNCLVVMLGGAIGTFQRYAVSVWALPVSRDLPWGTIFINISGSFVIGLFGTLTLSAGRYPASETLRLFVMIGLCGGHTTFLSFRLQTLDLMRGGAITRVALNVALSVILCIAAVAAGHFTATRVNDGARQIAQIAIEEEG